MTRNILEFLETLSAATGGLSPDERFIFCGFPGDPTKTHGSAWRPHSWRPGDMIPISPANTNGYLAISTFRQADDRSWRRRTDLFSSARLIMVDDVGTKVPEAAVAGARPTTVVETSPGNYQYGYWFGEPQRDVDLVRALIESFIRQRLADGDPGMAGVNRVFRLPSFLNGKPQYRNEHGRAWRCETRVFAPERLYTPRELARALGVQLRPRPQRRRASRAFLKHSPAVRQAEAMHEALELQFKQWGMVLRAAHNRADWLDVLCPWAEDHSDRGRTGASLRRPAEENDWQGAFVCHHGSHKDVRGIADVWQWVAARCLENLQQESGR